MYSKVKFIEILELFNASKRSAKIRKRLESNEITLSIKYSLQLSDTLKGGHR